MAHVEGGPLFEFRFRLRTLLVAVTTICLFLSLCPLIATEPGFTQFFYAFLLFSLGLMSLAVWMAARGFPKYLGRLLVCHMAIATFLFLGPILSYHINGRAWYDYGVSPWNPPPTYWGDGKYGISDYDPTFTRPVVWPVIGPVMYVMCWLSVSLMFIPPTAPVVAACVFVSAIRLRHVLTASQTRFVWASWAIGLIPVIYLVVWGGKVFDWIAD